MHEDQDQKRGKTQYMKVPISYSDFVDILVRSAQCFGYGAL